MVQHSTQSWTVGATVRVGFLALCVVECVASPRNGRPDGYVLKANRDSDVLGACVYSFVPHHGLRRHATVDEARAEIRA